MVRFVKSPVKLQNTAMIATLLSVIAPANLGIVVNGWPRPSFSYDRWLKLASHQGVTQICIDMQAHGGNPGYATVLYTGEKTRHM